MLAAAASGTVEVTALTFAIVCPLVMLGGFVDAVAGGGGLISLPAYLIAGLPPHNAIGTNKLSSFMGTSLTVARFTKLGYIPWRQAALFVVLALAASSAGARLALLLSPEVFTYILLVALPATAIYVYRSKAFEREASEGRSRRATLAIGAGAAAVIGVWDGFYGPGTGTFLILALTGLAHMQLREANGVSKAINLATNIAALAVMLHAGKVVLLLGLVAGLFGIAGNYLGTVLFDRGGAKIAKPMVIVVLCIFFVRTVWQLATGS